MRFDLFGCGKDVALIHVGHHYDELEIAVGKFGQCFILCGNLCEARRITQTQGGVFVEYLFVNTAIVFQHERVVLGGDEQHIENSLVHQIGKRCVAENDVFELRKLSHDVAGLYIL